MTRVIPSASATELTDRPLCGDAELWYIRGNVVARPFEGVTHKLCVGGTRLLGFGVGVESLLGVGVLAVVLDVPVQI